VKDRVSEAPRHRLPNVHESHGRHEAAKVLEGTLAAGTSKIVVELDVRVEVILDRFLPFPRHDEDVMDSACDGLLHDVLDGRLVDNRDHLLGLCLRVG